MKMHILEQKYTNWV